MATYYILNQMLNAEQQINVLHIITKLVNGKTNVSLNSKEISLFKALVETNPTVFNNITVSINKLLSQKTIQLTDLPAIIHIVSLAIKDVKNIDVDKFILIENVTLAIVESGVIPNTVLTSEIFGIIISCINLLKTNMEIVEKVESKCFHIC